MSNILTEYLVALGIKDNFTQNLNKALKEADRGVNKFVRNFAAQYVKAGVAVTTFVATANAGIVKFISNLEKSDEELTRFARSIGKSKDEAFKLKTSLDAMGKSLLDVQINPELRRYFLQLQADAAGIKPPDMSQGIKQVRDIKQEFTRLKQEGTYAVQWIGHYLFKYLQQPMAKSKDLLSGLNDKFIKNMPVWTKAVAKVMEAVVRLGTTILRGAMSIFNAIKKIFDMIPGEIKLVGSALAGLALFIRAGPIGKLIAIFSVLLLLLEDFFTYLDGGESLLGGFWQKLIDIFDALSNSGAIEKFKQGFANALEFIRNSLIRAKSYIVELLDKFKDSGAIEKFKELLSNIKKLFIEMSKPVKELGEKILSAFTGGGKNALEWFISNGFPALIDIISNVIGFITGLIGKLNDMSLTVPIIMAIVGAFAAFKTIKTVNGIIDGIASSIKNTTKLIDGMKNAKSSIQNLKDSFSGLTKAVSGLYDAKLKQHILNIKDKAETLYLQALYAKDAIVRRVTASAIWQNTTATLASIKAKAVEKAETLYLQALYAKDAVIRGISTAAQWTQTAATTAWNVIAGIATAVTTALGAAFAFLTSPIGLVVLAVAALIAITVLLIKNWDKVKEFLINVGSKIKEVFTNIVSWIKEKWSGIKESFADSDSFFGKFLHGVMVIFENYIGAILDFFKMLWENIKLIFSAIKAVFSGDFQGASDTVKQIFGNLISFFKSVFDRIVNIFAPIGNWFKDKFQNTKDSVTGVFENISDWFKDKFHNAKEKIVGIFSNIGSWFSRKYDEIKNGLKNLPDAFKDKFTSAKENAQNAFSNISNWFGGKWNNIKDKFSDTDSFFSRTFLAGMNAIENVFGGIVDYFKTVWTNIKLVFSVAKSVLSGDFQAAYNGVVQIWENIKGFFKRVVDRIKCVFSPIVNWFKDKASAIVDRFTSIPNLLRDKFLDAVTKIKEVFSPLVDWFRDKIGSIVGFFGGIGEKVSGVTDKVKSIFGGGKEKAEQAEKLPGYADGGISTKHHIAEISEGNKPEAIIPLSKPDKAKELISSSMKIVGMTNENVASKDDNAGIIEAVKVKLEAISTYVQHGFESLSQTIKALNKGSNTDSGINHSAIFDNIVNLIQSLHTSVKEFTVSVNKLAAKTAANIKPAHNPTNTVYQKIPDRQSEPVESDNNGNLIIYLNKILAAINGINKCSDNDAEKKFASVLSNKIDTVMQVISNLHKDVSRTINAITEKHTEQNEPNIISKLTTVLIDPLLAVIGSLKDSINGIKADKKASDNITLLFEKINVTLQGIQGTVYSVIDSITLNTAKEKGVQSLDVVVNKLDSIHLYLQKGYSLLMSLDKGLNQSVINIYNTSNYTINNNKIDMSSSYTIHSSSGRPEATVDAIKTNDQIKLRNLKGIID